MKTLQTILVAVTAVCALNFLAILLLLGGQWATGTLTSDDLVSLLQVLSGSKKYALDIQMLQDYRKLKDEETARLKKLDAEKGQPATRAADASALQEEEARLKARSEGETERIKRETATLQGLRAEIEGLKTQILKEKDALQGLKLQRATVEQAESTAKLRKTLANMDAGAIAQYLRQILADQPKIGRYEAARLLRMHCSPDLSAEIMTELGPEDTRQILPLLENNYADLPAGSIVERWTSPTHKEQKTPAEMLEAMKQMPFLQAFQVYLQLDAETKRQLVQLLQ